MRRYQIIHRTYYNFAAPVQLGAHTLLLRPREGPELRIEAMTLQITPTAALRWHRDVEDNAVAIATFDPQSTQQLAIESSAVIQHYNEAPLDFLVSDYAVNYPFAYTSDERAVLAPYQLSADPAANASLAQWISQVWSPGSAIQSYELLQRLSRQIQWSLRYQAREEPGVQSATETLNLGSGSCRDFANLFMELARQLGLAARFVSGYLNTPPSAVDYGATHAWAEVYLPGAGWKGFDPTLGELVGSQHIAVAVARLPQSVPPVAGGFYGLPNATLDVGVWVSEI